MDDILHGYLPDENYSPTEMEEDGNYPKELHLNWTYQDIPANTPDIPYPYYNGPGLCRKNYIDKKFNALLAACGTAEGFTYDLLKCITTNSNVYVQSRLVGNKFYGSEWKNITVEEMYHTLGMILKMSLVTIRLGGLKAYLNIEKKIYLSCDKAIDLKSVETNWTNEQLTYKCFCIFKQPSILKTEIQILAISATSYMLQFNTSTNTPRKLSFLSVIVLLTKERLPVHPDTTQDVSIMLPNQLSTGLICLSSLMQRLVTISSTT